MSFFPLSNVKIFRFLVCVIFCFVRNVVYVVHKCCKSCVVNSVLWTICLYLSIRKSYIINLHYIHNYGSKAKQQVQKEE